MAKIKVLVKDPGKKPELMEVENSLRELQKLIGGYIEAITKKGVVMLVDEEGYQKNLPANFMDYQVDDFIVGRAVFIGTKGNNFTDVPEGIARNILEVMPEACPEFWDDRKEE